MQDWAEKRRSSSGEAAPDRGDGPIRQLGFLSSALLASPARGRLALLVFGIVAVICLNAAAQIRLNGWQGAFFDALGARALPAFLTQLLVFVPIMASLLVLVVAQTWLQEMTKVRLREWLTRDLLDQWLAPRRACLLAHAGEIGVNPDQRMQEDARHLSELSAELGVGLLQATLLLVSFIGVLWVLSAHVVFGSGDGAFSIPGYMVWCALGYALDGLDADLAGRPAADPDQRRALRPRGQVPVRAGPRQRVRRGHSAARRRGRRASALDGTVDQVVQITSRLAGGLARLTWITSGYGWLAIVAPVLVAAPGYFQGSMSFGGLMMVVGAFNQVQQALRWFVDNFSRIADWRATLLRVVAFRRALLGAGGGHRHGRQHPARRRAGALPGARPAERGPGRGPGPARRSAGRDRAGRAGADRRRAGRRQEHALPGARRPLALGRRQPPASAAHQHDVHAAPSLSAAGHAARRRRLPVGARRFRRGRHRGGARPARPRPPDAGARSGAALGPRAVAGRPAAAGLRAPPAAPAALGLSRRRHGRARRRASPGRARPLRPRS